MGLAPDEVRGEVGWRPHVTLALLALGFLVLERQRLGGENPGGDGGADAGDAILTELLRKRPPTASEIVGAVRRVVRRNEEARIDPRCSKTKTFPLRRPRPGFSSP